MIDILTELMELLREYNIYLDDLPLNYDWERNLCGVFAIMDTVEEDENTYNYDLKIYVEAYNKDKMYQLGVVDELTKILTRRRMESGWIIPKNAYINHYTEGDKTSYILEFWVKTYGSN